jgi:uncharacterized HhH-GPD family protein
MVSRPPNQPDALHFTPESEANTLLAAEPLATLIGMLLDQQVTMETAFLAPWRLQQRLGEPLDAGRIAAMDPSELEDVFKQRPALHRFPGSMARRTHELCAYLVEHHEGRAEAVWDDAGSGDQLFARLKALPGFGNDKARIFVGVLGKRLGVRPNGWEAVAADWASIADVDSFARVAEIRAAKQAMKAAAKAKNPATAKKPAKAPS